MTHDHRLFAAFCDWISRREGQAQHRTREMVVSPLRGRVLELGLGVGTNWKYLNHSVEYAGIDPDRHMLRRAAQYSSAGARSWPIVQARAEQLPFADGAFDAVLATLTFCTVDDVPKALAEVRRVLKPDGKFHFWEHVRPAGRTRGVLLDAVAPVWRRVGAGCHPNRDTQAAIESAGFSLLELRSSQMGPLPVIAGVASP